jgi:hypothetical protein
MKEGVIAVLADFPAEGGELSEPFASFADSALPSEAMASRAQCRGAQSGARAGVAFIDSPPCV